MRVTAGEGAGGLGVTGSGCSHLRGYFWVLISGTSLCPLLGPLLGASNSAPEPPCAFLCHDLPLSVLCLPVCHLPGLGPPNQSPCDLLGLPPAPTLSYLCPQLAWEGGACRQLPRSHSWGEGQGPCGLLWTEPAPRPEEPQLGTLEASCMPAGTQRVTSLGR